MPKFHDVQQNTPEWKALRLGRITASNMNCIISPTGKESTQVDGYINELLYEQITGVRADTFEGNSHTDRGHEFEQEAADYFSMMYPDLELKRVGFVTTDDGRLGCSPDFLAGDDALLEIKTGKPSVMMEYYLSGNLEQKHRPQTQATAYITERARIFTMLYNPNIKPIIVESPRNGPFITAMLQFTDKAFVLMEEKRAALKQQGFFAEDPSRFLRAG